MPEIFVHLLSMRPDSEDELTIEDDASASVAPRCKCTRIGKGDFFHCSSCVHGTGRKPQRHFCINLSACCLCVRLRCRRVQAHLKAAFLPALSTLNGCSCPRVCEALQAQLNRTVGRARFQSPHLGRLRLTRLAQRACARKEIHMQCSDVAKKGFHNSLSFASPLCFATRTLAEAVAADAYSHVATATSAPRAPVPSRCFPPATRLVFGRPRLVHTLAWLHRLASVVRSAVWRCRRCQKTK